MRVLRCWRKGLSAPSLSSLTALHWSVVLLFNELRHHWRDRPLPICANLLHVLQGFYWSTVHSHIHKNTKWSTGATLIKYRQKRGEKKAEEEGKKNNFIHWLSRLGLTSRGLFDLFIFFFRASITQRATDVGSSSKSPWVESNARFLCILTGMSNVRARQSHRLQAGARRCACVQLPQLRASDVRN